MPGFPLPRSRTMVPVRTPFGIRTFTLLPVGSMKAASVPEIASVSDTWGATFMS